MEVLGRGMLKNDAAFSTIYSAITYSNIQMRILVAMNKYIFPRLETIEASLDSDIEAEDRVRISPDWSIQSYTIFMSQQKWIGVNVK